MDKEGNRIGPGKVTFLACSSQNSVFSEFTWKVSWASQALSPATAIQCFKMAFVFVIFP